MIGICRLKNRVQEYAWGSRTFIPELLGKPSPASKPQAELWMGAHPKAPSAVLLDEENVSLLRLTEENPVALLGKETAEKFSNTLPFLFKVLAAAEPLSIQAHPNRRQAEEGFARESRLGIPLDAFQRNYKDENHKPELFSALTPFWAMKGFRPIQQMLALLKEIRFESIQKEIEAFEAMPDGRGLRIFFKTLMTLSSDRKVQVVNEAVHWAQGSHGRGTQKIKDVKKWIKRLSQGYPGDIGVLGPVLLNLIHMNPGEALFIKAGELHAYLEGAGIELMANSDNVLRGGLTRKHIDGEELMRILRFEESELRKLGTRVLASGETVYVSQAEEFRLSQIRIHEERDFTSSTERSVEIVLCVDGSASIADMETKAELPMKRGDSLLIPAAVEQYRIHGSALIYKASVSL